jgi:hypothetical protein
MLTNVGRNRGESGNMADIKVELSFSIHTHVTYGIWILGFIGWFSHGIDKFDIVQALIA